VRDNKHDICVHCGEPIERVEFTWWYHPPPFTGMMRERGKVCIVDQYCGRLKDNGTSFALPANGAVVIRNEERA